MAELYDYVAFTILIGVGATAVLDISSAAQTRLLGVPAPDFGLLGRWLGHMAHGQFRHDAIAAAPPIRRERLIGWVAHYAIGIAFAAVLIAGWGLDWVRQPTLGPALIVGIGSAAAPFLVMQPGMGAGIAASRTPRPSAARLQSVVTHAIFGLGLYGAGWVTSWVQS